MNEITFENVSDLHFDYQNPRLKEFGIKRTTPEIDILKTLWEAMDIKELIQSMCASGFFPHEALIVSEEEGKKVVIEGNRRLAAVKVILNDELARELNYDVPDISDQNRRSLLKLPVIVSSRNESWRYLGFKHVNGPAKWSSYAKAAYLAHVHNEYDIPLSDIANQIGDRHNTVQRLYRGFMVLSQAEEFGVFDRENRFNSRLAFSHLYTALDYPQISAFLSIEPMSEERANPIPSENADRLGELLIWLYGNRRDRIPPVVRSQNPDLRNLAYVIGNEKSISALRKGIELSRALELSRPPSDIFKEALLAAERELLTAHTYQTTGYRGDVDTLKLSGTIAVLADELYNEMVRKYEGDNTGRKYIKE